MLSLSSDESFHFEILRVLGHSRYGGADVAEVLQAASLIQPGNFESFHDAFETLAVRVNSQANQIDAKKHPISARDAYFRAANYFRAADFYLHGNPEDPRIYSLWKKQTIAFDKAIGLMDIPGERLMLKGSGFDVPAIFYRASLDPATRRPTIILGNGYDGSQEELLHVAGFAALERGYNVITYEGPGQPSVVRYQRRGFIAEWETVVTPVVDYLFARPEVDTSRIALFGYSLGGFLALRAAAFEHRLAAVMAVDGVYSVHQSFSSQTSPELLASLSLGGKPESDQQNASNPQTSEGGAAGGVSGGTADFGEIIGTLMKSDRIPTGVKWGIGQGMWSFMASSAAEFSAKTEAMTLEGISAKIQCPVWVGEASNDQFFAGQPELVKRALGDRAHFVRLTDEDAAGAHCHVGAAVLLNQLLFDWFAALRLK